MWEEGGMLFLQLEEDPMVKEEGDGGGETFFLGKASFSWLEARTEGKLQLH